MLFFIGLIIVITSIVVGYTMHYGELILLWQPNEIVIIVGAGIGSMVIANSISSLKKTFNALKNLIKGTPYNKEDYLELLLLHFNIFKLIKTKGMLEIESHIDDIQNSTILNKVKIFKKNNFIKDFVTDNIRLLTMGVISPHQFEDMIDKELEVYKEDIETPGNVLRTLADALPALGIVAAVLGVIVTMKSIMEPPDVLGSLIAAALVGTFLGVLLSYGLVGPIGNFLNKYAHDELQLLNSINVAFITYLNDNPPIIIVEFMRKSISEDIRPSFVELDNYINKHSMKVA